MKINAKFQIDNTRFKFNITFEKNNAKFEVIILSLKI